LIGIYNLKQLISIRGLLRLNLDNYNYQECPRIVVLSGKLFPLAKILKIAIMIILAFID
jgi:uncharacterized protein YlaN (UPF0358 family)